jgi:hypothetical protein
MLDLTLDNLNVFATKCVRQIFRERRCKRDACGAARLLEQKGEGSGATGMCIGRATRESSRMQARYGARSAGRVRPIKRPRDALLLRTHLLFEPTG